MKHSRLMFIVVILMALVGILPVVAQDQTPTVKFSYNGVELQKWENGVIVQTWTLPNSLDTQQTVAALNARAQSGDPEIRYVFQDDRMYHLRDGQIVNLWLLRGGRWVEDPILDVQYTYNGRMLQRFVNGEIQQAWTLPNGLETQQLVVMMQAEANKLVAAHMYQELYVDVVIAHVPALSAGNFTLHYLPVDKVPDMTWYKPEIAAALTQALTTPISDPVVLATGDLVVTQHPVGTKFAELLGIPPLPQQGTEALYDVYRIEAGKVTDLWLGYDLPALINANK